MRSVLPVTPARASNRSLSAARVAIFVTVAGWLAFVAMTLSKAFFGNAFSIRYAVDAVIYISVVTLLTGSALAYLLARLGFLYRTREHHRIGRVAIDSFFGLFTPTLTVLVPSYCEEPEVIRQTLLSAALQEYPNLRIVLLIDDPPNPSDAHELELLHKARKLPGQIEELLRGPGELFERASEAFQARNLLHDEVSGDELRALASVYDAARSFLAGLAGDAGGRDHSAEFLRGSVVLALAEDFGTVAAALRRAADENATLSPARALELYRRLAWTFRVELTSFERKQYMSLSRERNKAMNLNSYIGLMGGRYHERSTARGRALVPADGAVFDLDVPETDYVLTLDADSILLPEYCLRLVYLLEQPESERVAVAQTPYSAFPGSASSIERIAGATTDIQHMIHQGLTYYGATFWVGANAVLRKRALDEIVEIDREGGYVIRRYIKDRTVIEDTESSVDLGIKGWKLFNYPERLSYSATPPDFGSLCVQRQRWANGGLLILEKFRRYVAARREISKRDRSVAELFLRMNYLASIAWVSFGLIVLLTYPFNGALLSPIVLATALPYFLAMASDLRRCGYKHLDVIRIYGFNLILLPVNMLGVLKSIGQAIGGQKIAFARTPKVRNRTAASITFVVVPYLIIAFSVFTIWRDLNHQHYVHAGYAAVNALVCTYALFAFIGIRNSLVDLWLNVVQWIYRPEQESAEHVAEELDWVTVLHDGAHHDPSPIPAAVASIADEPARPAFERRSTGPLALARSGRRHDDGVSTLTVAGVLGEALREVRDRGRVVLRLDGSAVELVVEPFASE